MDNIKLVRLVSGEDVIAFFEEDEYEYLLGNPMTVFFKRMPTGKAIMMMSPWLPLELIEEDIISIDKSQVLTIMNPRKHLSEYFTKTVFEMETELDVFDESLRDASHSEEEDSDDEFLDMLEEFGQDTDGSKRTIH